MPNPRLAVLAAPLVAGLALSTAQPAHADDAAKWADSISISAYLQAGITSNPAVRNPQNNWGHLFTDKTNQLLINQGAFTIQRELDKEAKGYDFGFKFQMMGGSDARYTHLLGFFPKMVADRYQMDLVEANVQVHTPWLTAGGIDFKFGVFTTLLGAETIDPSTNAFYTHSYIFNFGLPLKHTGALAAVHLVPEVDLYLGLTTGVNTSFGKDGDNNSSLAGMAGIGLNLMDGKLTVLAMSHFGPENPTLTVPNAARYYRTFGDVVVTYKPNDKWSFTTEFNYVREDLNSATGYGGAQYVSYALTDTVKLNLRGEVWRDDKGFFVAAFPGNLGFVNAQLGMPATVISAKPTTYGSLSLGFTYKPELKNKTVGLMVRPEIRYDQSLNGTRPYNGGRDGGAFTIASDIVLTF